MALHLHRDLQLRYLDKDQSLQCRIMATSSLLPSIALSSNCLSVFRLAILRKELSYERYGGERMSLALTLTVVRHRP
jgi:hypothetical protein